VPVLLGAVSVGLLLLARGIRERDGKKLEITDGLKNEITRFSILESSFSLLSGMSVVSCMIAVQLGVPKNLERWMFCGSIALFVLTGMVSYWALKNTNKIIRNRSR
jgi:hypothetical protein